MARLLLFCVIYLYASAVVAQTQMPDVQINNINGKPMNTRSILNENVPVVITFWTTICKPCLQELNTFAEQWEEWQSEARFRIVAVSTDDARSASKVRAYVAANRWPFTVLLDRNQDFKRALNVSTIPHLYIVDAKGNVVYSRIGYSPGNESKVLDVLKGL